MKLKFYKYHGCGNDFIIIDNRDKKLPTGFFTQIKALCDRRFGIGADGLMLLQSKNKFDFEMIYYNADGGLGSMCGNGGRCIVAFAKFLKIPSQQKNKYFFLAADGSHEASLLQNGNISLKMQDVLKVKKNKDKDFILNTGSPHYIKFVEKLDEIDVRSLGQRIRNNTTYKKEGINVNFIQMNKLGIQMRTYERGVEDETYSCGTGVTAAAIVYCLENDFLTEEMQIKIGTRGGNFEVKLAYDGDKFHSIYLIGNAVQIYKGEIEI